MPHRTAATCSKAQTAADLELRMERRRGNECTDGQNAGVRPPVETTLARTRLPAVGSDDGG